MSAAIELMHVLAKAATALVKLPASPDHPGIHLALVGFSMVSRWPPCAPSTRHDAVRARRVGAAWV